MSRIILGLPERFWARVAIQGAGYDTPCLLWTGSRYTDGYGQFSQDGKGGGAHRWAYQAIVGSVSEGLQLDHLCRNRRCVNPDHLEPVTPSENTRRGIGPAAVNARKTRCPKGHPLDATNTDVFSDGARRCRACRRAANAVANARYRARKKSRSS